MRQFLLVLFTALLGLSLTACNGAAKPSWKNSESNTDTSSQEENTLDSEGIFEEENIESNLSTSNILIVYFSRWGNTEYPSDVDATTSASIVVDGDIRYGTTEYIANMIAEKVGGDLHRIETVTPYTTDFDELRDVNHDEMNRNYLPELKKGDLDISAYDTVFVGYPVWATDVPQAVLSFLNEYDLTGKTVIPFCTHDGYGAGGSYQTIAEASHAAVSLDGIAIEAKDVPNA
ncbi:flavodoxin [Roseburia hominis]